ncbi:N-lysine methyltransferase setd6 [Erpetoichthys calabaricus]|uniref:N-lysine methyltransferase setd6 n=1 Tax=Erpetoichthys calabaricus TaxID=27687 RepID=UPI00223419B7|nr:N-lysine methyltransferase setd6 [Erpetoichthys calabaricus]
MVHVVLFSSLTSCNMASDPKQAKLDGDCRLGISEDPVLDRFLCWCKKAGIKLSSKVFMTKHGTVSDYGMLAKEDIEEGEEIFSIPRTALLSQETTAIHALLEKEKDSLKSQSGWVPLLLALMFEYNKTDSYWNPYLSMWPDFTVIDQPMFWTKEEREALLRGTGITEAVEKDLQNIEKEYNDIILPFIQTHSDLFDPEKHMLELYKSLVAFVMAYSFQEPIDDDDDDDDDNDDDSTDKESTLPMMVPVADILNHVANHNANLEYEVDCLKMISIRKIHRGEEVFNTYGDLANWQLLHMYGFAEPYPSNRNDTVDVLMTTIYKAALQAANSDTERSILRDKWDLLCHLDIASNDGAFVFGCSGSLTEEELYTTLKVLCMSEEHFKEFKENKGWEEAEDSDEEVMAMSLSNEGIPKLSFPFKQLLWNTIVLSVQLYSSDIKEDMQLIQNMGKNVKLSRREQWALYVRYGQKVILSNLLQMTQPH